MGTLQSLPCGSLSICPPVGQSLARLTAVTVHVETWCLGSGWRPKHDGVWCSLFLLLRIGLGVCLRVDENCLPFRSWTLGH